MKKKILVCGATGFIGRNVTERLVQRGDFEVTGTYHHSKPYFMKGLEMVKVDLRKEEEVNKVVEGKDIILQMAATTSGAKDIVTRPYIHVTDNAVMNSLLLRSAFDFGVSHFIFPSCTVMYQPSETLVKEEDFNPSIDLLRSYFGIGNTKVYIEKMCEFFSRLGKTRHTVIRHSNIYGPFDKYDLEKSHVFGATITKVMTTKKDDKIVVWGEGTEERDLLYVDDLMDFIELAIEKQDEPYKLYNVGLGKATSVSNLVKKIMYSAGSNSKIEYDLTKPTIKTTLCLDTTRAKRELGWEPKISLEEGIEKTINWYRTNIKK
jgi:nucleoside-diphosphate-sugar epimerase